jgi:L-ascorbate 6-phosphate lactonase
MNAQSIPVLPLGQVGFRLEFDHTVVYIDPYLSDSVREKEAADLERLAPIPIDPAMVQDADSVLITHHHRDHCDLDTLLPLADASPQAVFIGPGPVVRALAASGIAERRLRQCKQGVPITLATKLSVTCLAASHPTAEYDDDGQPLFVGYLLQWGGRQIYHAGDTALTDDLLQQLRAVGKIDTAFLPVNETNYFRNRRGIIGNMSVREAFGLAEELGIDAVVPTHWDMFAANQVFPEEIELLYEKLVPRFKLIMRPSEV